MRSRPALYRKTCSNFDSRERPGPSTRRRPPRSIAVVGGGMAGAAAARTLAERGFQVTVFDTARGPGGRASRRRDIGREFDHGAQYFTVRDHRFRRLVESLRRNGVVDEWRGRIVSIGRTRMSKAPMASEPLPRYVGVPGMNSLVRSLSAGLDVRYHHRVESVQPDGMRWRLSVDGGRDLGSFDVVLVAAPAPQTAVLLREPAPHLARRADTVTMRPCWCLMLAFSERLETGFDGALVDVGGPLAWIARNSSKPGRARGETWVVHAAHDWSQKHLECPADIVADRLTTAFFEVTGVPSLRPTVARTHRWRYAQVGRALGEACLYDAGLGLGAAGDWCLEPRIEAAYLSGLALAGRVAGQPAWAPEAAAESLSSSCGRA
ncbi:MAG: NAD(P)/FAD-dependent oxidoreductase [Planctomycetota bacterium]